MNFNQDKKVEQFDLKTTSVNEIENYFSKMISGHIRPNINISPKGLFRARIVTGKNINDLSTTKSIWYPDFSEIDQNYHHFNRCSDKGQNFFYSSNYLGTTIKELNPKDKDLILIGVFNMINESTKIRSQFAGIEALRRNTNHKSTLENYEYPTIQDKRIEQYISSKFQERINDYEGEKYKPSIAFSNILLKNNGIDCLIYPSVASNLEYVNYGIKPEFVDRFLICKSTYIYKIRRTETEFELIPEQYGKGIIVNSNKPRDSKIEWVEITELERKQTLKYSL